MIVTYGQPGPGARSLADMVVGHVDRHAPYVTDSDRADALALAFVDVAERVYPGGLAKGGTTGVDFEREGVMVRVVALEVPPAPPPVAPVEDLARVAFEAYGASTGGKTWDGKNIPPFDEVRARTPHVAAAWEAAVRAVLAAR